MFCFQEVTVKSAKLRDKQKALVWCFTSQSPLSEMGQEKELSCRIKPLYVCRLLLSNTHTQKSLHFGMH